MNAKNVGNHELLVVYRCHHCRDRPNIHHRCGLWIALPAGCFTEESLHIYGYVPLVKEYLYKKTYIF